jgi:DNA-binding NtrC family response regulator
MNTVRDFKIFLVDDDEFTLTLTKHHLENLDYSDVTLFRNGTDCLNNLIARPQIIFLDHNMDDLTGFDVLKKIMRFDPNIQVVMLSGQSNISTAVDALKYGAFDYIVKDDQSLNRISNVMHRITEIHELLEKSKPSVWKKIGAFI